MEVPETVTLRRFWVCFDEFKYKDFQNINIWMVTFGKMGAKWFGGVFFIYISKMLHQSLFEWAFSLAHIEFLTVCTLQTVNKVRAVASIIFAALEGLACSR